MCAYFISDECQRMAAIWEFFRRNCPDLNLHIVRYNSHAFKQDRTMIKPTQEEREMSIKERFVITYLFYRAQDGFPVVTRDPEYTLRQYVRTL